MSTSVSSSNSSTKSSRNRRVSRRVLIVVSSVLTILLVTMVVLYQGRISGTEFAPSHFETREFSFYEIPVLHLQISPIRRKVKTVPVARQLRAKSYIQVPRGKKPDTWHLVDFYRGPISTPADALLLIDELTLNDGGSPFWKAWNTDHPQRAAVLWPIVQTLAERELYILTPELLLLARSLPGGDDPAALGDAIDQWLVDQYVELVKDLRDANRNRLADELLAEAVADFPHSQRLEALKSAADE